MLSDLCEHIPCQLCYVGVLTDDVRQPPLTDLLETVLAQGMDTLALVVAVEVSVSIHQKFELVPNNAGKCRSHHCP